MINTNYRTDENRIIYQSSLSVLLLLSLIFRNVKRYYTYYSQLISDILNFDFLAIVGRVVYSLRSGNYITFSFCNGRRKLSFSRSTFNTLALAHFDLPLQCGRFRRTRGRISAARTIPARRWNYSRLSVPAQPRAPAPVHCPPVP